MNIGGTFMAAFFGSVILNLLHFHGDGQFHYKVKYSGAAMTIVLLLLWSLSDSHLIAKDWMYGAIYVWLTAEQICSIYCRQRERMRRGAGTGKTETLKC